VAGPREDIDPLTSLRFFAAASVFGAHVFEIPGLGWMLLPTGTLGAIGVSVFFVLSGYIIAYSYGDRNWRGEFARTTREFYWNRFARIYPLHWLMFFVALPLGFNLDASDAWPLIYSSPATLTLTENLYPGFYWGYQPVRAAWTLSCEFLFYFWSPLIFFALRGRRAPLEASLIILGVYCLVLVILVSAFPLNWFGYLHLPEYLIGIVGYHIARRVNLRPLANWLLVAGIFLLGLASVTYASHAKELRTPLFIFGPPFFIYGPAALLVVWGFAHASGAWKGFLSRPALVYLGHASFSFYLLHEPLLRYTNVLFTRNHWVIPHVWSWPVAVFALALCTLASVVCFKFYENPARLKLRSLRKKPARPARAMVSETVS
jgi:peptidoglycan/LPS O-acetylase OafA/YrhL